MSYRNSKKSENGTKRRTNLAAIIVAAALATTFLTTAAVSGIAFASKGFNNGNVETWFEREVNEENLIKVGEYSKSLPTEVGKDGELKLTKKDDGTLLLKGEFNDASQTEKAVHPIPFVSVTVEPGTYVISSGNKHADKDTFYLQYEYLKDGEMQTNSVYGEDVKVEFTEQTTVTFSIAVMNGESFFGILSYLRPVLVPDGVANTGFYK